VPWSLSFAASAAQPPQPQVEVEVDEIQVDGVIEIRKEGSKSLT
jgi:hypothetical protein